VVSRTEIERRDHRRFLGEFVLHIEYEQLQSLHGKVSFVVTGYDDQPDELFEIRAVRDYFTCLQIYWPCWHYYADHTNNCFKMVACCIMGDLRAHRYADASQIEVTVNYDVLEQLHRTARYPGLEEP